MRGRHRWAAFAACAGLVIAGCGSDDEDPVSSAADTASASVAPSTTTGAAAPVTTGGATSESPIQFTEGNAQKADVDRTGEVIRIGISNDEGGTFSLPEFRIGAEVGAQYVNDHGGINGAMIEFVHCASDASPEGAINCANTFVEEGVDMATYGIEVAIDAALPVYADAGIPMIVRAGHGDKQRLDSNTTIVGSPLVAYTVWPQKTIKDLGASKLAFIAEDTSAGRRFAKSLAEWAPKLDVEIVSTTFVDPANPDYTAAVQTGISGGAEAIWANVSDPGCIAFVTAVDQLAYDGIVIAGACSQYISVLGDASIGTLTLIDAYFPDVAAAAPPKIKENIEIYKDAMTAAGQEQYIRGFAALSFSFVQDLKTLLETIPEGPINAATIDAVRRVDQRLPSYIAPDFNCGAHAWPSDPAFCRAAILMLEVVEEDGELIRKPLIDENFGFVFDPAIASSIGS